MTNVDVVVGKNNSSHERIEKLCNAFDYRYHFDTKEMEVLMHKADIYIGKGWYNDSERVMMITFSIDRGS